MTVDAAAADADGDTRSGQDVLPQEEEHADLRIPPAKQPFLQGFRVGSIVWDEAG
jgi:hypothetical protein